MQKFTTLLFALLYFSSTYSQNYKVQLTEACSIIKDPVSGGIYDIFDWKSTNNILIFDVSDNLVQIIDSNKIVQKFYILETLNKFNSNGETNYVFNCIETYSYDNFQKSYKGKLKLNLRKEDKNKRSVLIFENEGVISIYRGLKMEE